MPKKFFNSKETQEVQAEKNRVRMRLKRRVARLKLEEKIYAHLKAEAEKKALAAHLVSRIQFPDTPIVHDIESLIEDSVKNQKGE